MDTNRKLKSGLKLSIVKKGEDRTSSLALTAHGREYLGALVGSDTNLMHISSEQVVLALSAAASDFPVTEITTMTESEKPGLFSPIVLKVMIDYAIRTQHPLKYTLKDTRGDIHLEYEDVRDILPFYKPGPIAISKINEKYSANKDSLKMTDAETPSKLRQYALKGLKRNFPLYDSASAYGTAVYTAKGNVYYAGQYSSPDKRLNLHSEMVAILTALMNNDQNIKAIGIVSSKYPDSPCNMCGICRQFISEMSAKFKISPDLYCFAEKTKDFKKTKIEEYLPESWSSKNW